MRSSAAIVNFAPSCAPGITPIASPMANVQSMSPRNACVIVPGMAKMPTHASDVADRVAERETHPGRKCGNHQDAATDAEEPGEGARADPDQREHPPFVSQLGEGSGGAVGAPAIGNAVRMR